MEVAEMRALQASQRKADAEDDQELLRSLIRKVTILHTAGATLADIGQEVVYHLDAERYARQGVETFLLPWLTDTADGQMLLAQAARVIRDRRMKAGL